MNGSISLSCLKIHLQTKSFNLFRKYFLYNSHNFCRKEPNTFVEKSWKYANTWMSPCNAQLQLKLKKMIKISICSFVCQLTITKKGNCTRRCFSEKSYYETKNLGKLNFKVKYKYFHHSKAWEEFLLSQCLVILFLAAGCYTTKWSRLP